MYNPSKFKLKIYPNFRKLKQIKVSNGFYTYKRKHPKQLQKEER